MSTKKLILIFLTTLLFSTALFENTSAEPVQKKKMAIFIMIPIDLEKPMEVYEKTFKKISTEIDTSTFEIIPFEISQEAVFNYARKNYPGKGPNPFAGLDELENLKELTQAIGADSSIFVGIGIVTAKLPEGPRQLPLTHTRFFKMPEKITSMDFANLDDTFDPNNSSNIFDSAILRTVDQFIERQKKSPFSNIKQFF